jgi:putative ABC transport system permease protein
MPIPVYYSLRNLWTRRLTTALTATGMALVVFVFAATLMLAEGLEQTLVATGSPENVVLIRKGSETEVQSGVEREQTAILANQPEVASGRDGLPLFARELVVLINLPRRGSGDQVNVVIRGIAPASLALRPQVRLAEGKLPRPGSTEIAVGSSIVRRFQGVALGQSLRFGLRDWQVVGIFDAGATGFSSEIWGDAEQLMQAFRRQAYSSVLFRLRDPQAFESFRQRIEREPRLTLEAQRETDFYAGQSEVMATFLRILGITLTLIFSIGAVIGAMITMYAAVATRTAEIGTLRALGFARRHILLAFLAESLLLGLLGGLAGLFLASFLQLLTISTMNWQTFAELAFGFTLSPTIAWQSLLFALAMGLAGGLLPALRAARMELVEAMRSG